MTDDNRELNIAIKLAGDIEEQIIDRNREVAKLGQVGYLFGNQAIPHITLYSVEYPEENEAIVRRDFYHFVKKIQPFELELTNVDIDGNYAQVIVRPDEQIVDLHTRVMERFSPMREGYIRDKFCDPDFLKTIPEGEKESIAKWGRPMVGDFFVPHISVGKLVDGKNIPENYLTWQAQKMPVKELIVGRGGPWGSIVEILEISKLG